MKNYSRIICVFLIVVMMLAVFAGCAKSDEEKNNNNEEQTTAEQTEVTKSASEEALDTITLEKYTYNDGTFSIFCRESVGNSTNELKQDEQSDEVLEQGVYLRNITLAERFSMKYEVTPVNDVAAKFKNSMTSGDYKYPVAFPDMGTAATLAAANKLQDFNAVDTLVLDMPWWDQGTRELRLADRVFFMNSDINYMAHDVTYLMLFSKKLATDVKLPDMYEIVKNKEWTFDKLMSLVKDVSNYSDDGNDSNDRYGLMCTSAYGTTFFYGSGLKYIGTVDGENKLLINDTQINKINTLLERIKTLYTVDNTTFEIPAGKEMEAMNMFSADQGLFYGEVASYIVNLRNMSGDFGVIPVPMYDATQGDYYTFVSPIASTMIIAKGIDDQQLSDIGQVIEAMAIYSAQMVKPAYYDIVLKSKQARDEQSGEMLDIIFSHRVYDMAQYYSTFDMSGIFQACVSSHSTDFASKFKRTSDKFDKTLKKLEAKIK